MADPIQGVVITGTIGAGKTTIASVVSEVLHGQGIRHAILELDWFGELYPPPDLEDRFNLALAHRNLAAVWPNFVAAGATKAVVTATLESRAELDGLKGALGGVDLTVVRLTTSPEAIAERLRARERGRLLDDFLDRTLVLEANFQQIELEDFTVSNDGRPAWEVAEEIVELLRWR